MLERFFKLRTHDTTPGIEITAGMVTFLTAAYILIVNPAVLSATGMPRDALFTATALGAIVGSLLMGLFANMPFLLAPGMGINAFFAFVVVLGKGYTWNEALTAVFLSGILFVLSSAFGIREALIRAFPESLRYSMSVALGLMICSLGMSNCGLIVKSEVFLALGDIKHGAPMLAMIGLLVTGVLLALGVRAGILFGIVITTLIGIPLGQTAWQPLMESGIWSAPPSIAPLSLAFSFDWSRIMTVDFLIIIFTFLFIDIFDSLGTFMGVLSKVEGGMETYKTRIPRALLCDAVATVAGSCFGTSTVTAYVESSTGIAAGGKTGLTAVSTSFFLIVALFFWPLFQIVPSAATAPALIVVGMYLMGVAVKINFNDVTEGLPAIVCIMVTALTWSISDGLTFGWIGYLIFMIFSGRARSLNLISIIVGLVFLVRIALM